MDIRCFAFILAPQYDSRSDAIWQATGSDLQRNSVQRNIDTNSYTTQHYAFLTGSDNGGAIGIAYLGTTCLRAGQGKLKYFMSNINTKCL